MTINEIKQALREVKKICMKMQYCGDCPLKVGKISCPMSTTEEYPSAWALDWEE